MKKKICMVVQNSMVKGGIAAVANGYRGSQLEEEFEIIYVESYNDGGKLKKIIKAIDGYLRFAKVMSIDKPVLIHIHSSFGPSFYRKIPFIYMAAWLKKPVINHIHGSAFNDFFVNAGEMKKGLIKKVYGKCSVLVALSEEMKINLSQIVQYQNVVVIENYSIVHRHAIQERLNRKSNNIILFLGVITKQKGCYDIPTVVQQVVKVIPEARFVLAGSGDIDQIKKLLYEKNVQNYVEFPGWVRAEEKDRLLRKADVFFLPSYSEGMPMSILDAMGYGLPVVSTNVGGIPKLVKNDITGYLCHPGDLEEFTSAICMLLEERTNKNIALNCVELVDTAYSLECHIKRLSALYHKLTPSRGLGLVSAINDVQGERNIR